MASETTQISLCRNDYTVGWVCALQKEQTAATAMLDEKHPDLPKPHNDPNAYTLGSISGHNIVIACLPPGEIATVPAATTSTWMVSTFQSIKFGLLVGIGGGIPKNKVRLGDVVVSTISHDLPGVVQWDSGKNTPDGFVRTGALSPPPRSLGTALAKLRTNHDLDGPQIQHHLDQLGRRYPRLAAKYLKSDSMEDILFPTAYQHVDGKDAITADGDEDETDTEDGSCKSCDKTKVVNRRPREMQVHFGLIASGNQVIRNASFRNEINDKLGGRVLCIEMEAAGLMNNFPCLVIRGICDYADSHKNKAWQEHAAAIAAAFAKELLGCVQPSDVDHELPAKEKLHQAEDDAIMNWLSSIAADYGSVKNGILARRQDGTCQWLLKSEKLQTWMKTGNQIFFCHGMPGAGKTFAASIVIEHILRHQKEYQDRKIGVAFVYCDFKRQHEQTYEHILRSLLKQLVQGQSSIPDVVKRLYQGFRKPHDPPPLTDILEALKTVVCIYSRVFILIDALDELKYPTEILAQLRSLQSETRVKLLITSRSTDELRELFKEDMTMEISAHSEDVETFLDSQMCNLELLRDEGEPEDDDLPEQTRAELKTRIKSQISKAANGIFLLARLHLDSLGDKTTPQAVFNALKSLPKGPHALAESYGKTIERIRSQRPGLRLLAEKVLTLLTCAATQLTTSELQHVLALYDDVNSALDQNDLVRKRIMVSVCAGLVTVNKDNNVIRLLHDTTREYLATHMSCIAPREDGKILANPMEVDRELAKLGFFHIESMVFAGSFAEHRLGYLETLYPADTALLRAVQLRDKAMVELLLAADGVDVNLRDAKGVTPLLEALSGYQIAMAELLLAAEDIDPDIPDKNQITPLLMAVQSRETSFKSFLFRLKQTEPDSQNATGDRWYFGSLVNRPGPVSVFKKTKIFLELQDREKLVELLLATGKVDVNSQDKSGSTPLAAAAKKDYSGIVQLLLAQNRIQSNLQDETGMTPLMWAASEGSRESLKLLLAVNEVKPNLKKRTGQTALALASGRGRIECLKLLIDTEAVDCNIKDLSGRTPLMAAKLWKMARWSSCSVVTVGIKRLV
ncbi:hypothetical protein CDD80_2945 [Ophiocordyceps camponoti-rufipedis]|uniref:Uncharacterized protein n=1 Tax=Ophiocordyceps camponoti-rufipedis TaxID=2004952 RepID=A0A2C5Z4B9_9HYPO|nr:hypothetical protein CDD80_2945 [Ophiocordyceps camponoti-rufipedis]